MIRLQRIVKARFPTDQKSWMFLNCRLKSGFRSGLGSGFGSRFSLDPGSNKSVGWGSWWNLLLLDKMNVLSAVGKQLILAGASGNQKKKQNSTSSRENKYISCPKIGIFAMYMGFCQIPYIYLYLKFKIPVQL